MSPALELELPLFRTTPADPNVQWLESILDERRGWLTAREIAAASGDRVDDRQVRALAAASPSIISGQRGYRHLRHASAEEIDHAASWLESQARAMLDRSVRIRRRAHELVG